MESKKQPLAAQRNIFRAKKRDAAQNYVLVIHGGAGTMNRQNSTPEKRAKYRATLIRALKAGHEVLHLGGEAMDAAVAAVTVLEGQSFTLLDQQSCDFNRTSSLERN